MNPEESLRLARVTLSVAKDWSELLLRPDKHPYIVCDARGQARFSNWESAAEIAIARQGFVKLPDGTTVQADECCRLLERGDSKC